MNSENIEVSGNNLSLDREIEQSWIAEAKSRINSYRKGDTGTIMGKKVFHYIY
ncbi:MAG TPA: addiction module protein [Spirochaetota bacterium]|nr:addiction module protein [Spirochaetota bacterium]